MIIYNTKDGDVLDDICYRFYGHLDGTVEKVLKAAAMTYVAALAVSLAQLLRLVLIVGGSRGRRN